MINIKKIQTEYITDINGNKKSVVLSIQDYNELIEDIEDISAVAERRNETTISHTEFVKELKINGLL